MHTARPWTYQENGEEPGWFQVWHDEHGSGFTVAEGIGDEANARLIAAAPELLEECKARLRARHEELPIGLRYDSTADNDPEIVRLRALIAKAEGRS